MSYSEALRRLKMRPAGGNHRLFRKWVDSIWQIPTDHFDPHAAFRELARSRSPRRPLASFLVEHSCINRQNLKLRLYQEGLKQPICEICGQGEIWRGEVMALILDHINGVPDDNRLGNLRIVCPNCAATFSTHCGRKNRSTRSIRNCEECERTFVPSSASTRFCSQTCAGLEKSRRTLGVPRPERRKVERPPYDQLMSELAATSYVAVGRKYGVSDNAVRKWIRQYRLEQETAEVEARPRAA